MNIKQLERIVLQNTTEKYMKEPDTLADNAENISLRRELCLNTKGEYMKEYRNIVLWYPMLGSTISVYQSIAELRQARGKLQLAMLLVYIFFSLFSWHCWQAQFQLAI